MAGLRSNLPDRPIRRHEGNVSAARLGRQRTTAGKRSRRQSFQEASRARTPDSPLEYGLKRSALFRGILHVFFDVTELRLTLAEVLFNVAFSFQCLVAHELAGRFLDGSFRLFDAALHLVFVHAHDMLL